MSLLLRVFLPKLFNGFFSRDDAGDDAAGRIDTATLPNGIVTTHRYDDNGRLAQLGHTKGTAIVTGVRYTVAGNGQRTRAEEFDSNSTLGTDGPVDPALVRDYRYDGVGRLTQETVTDRSNTVIRTTVYGYDKVGNRKVKTDSTAAGIETIAYGYDGNDRLTQETRTTTTGSQATTTYAWDANGNLKSKAIGTSATFYGWNADNRLIEVKQGTSDVAAQTVARYSYDANGNRVQKAEPGQDGQADKVTRYLTDNTFAHAQVVQESTTQGNATESTRYVWGAGLIAQSKGGQDAFHHADGLGSVKALTDADGDATDAYQYDAFGAVESQTGSTVNAYRYTGEYFDDAINLQYNRARWYDANLGRFTAQDTFSGAPVKPVTLNKYLYADGDPINKRDPSGKFGISGAMAGISVGLTLANVAVTSFIVTTDVMEGDYTGAAKDLAISLVIAKLAMVGSVARAVVAKSFGIFSNLVRGSRTVTLYRAVEPAEYASIMATKQFSWGPYPTNMKQFGFTLEEVIKYADTNKAYAAIIKVTVDESVIKLGHFSKTIDSSIFKNGVLTFDQLNALNKAIVSITHVF